MFTVEIYKVDGRVKKTKYNPNGERLVQKSDGHGALGSPKEAVELHFQKLYPAPKYRVAVHETYVTRKNMMSGKEFQERYDTPYYCSPSSETYWSM